MNIRNSHVFFLFLLYWLPFQVLAESIPEPVYINLQDSVIVEPDSLSKKQETIPQKITEFDSILIKDLFSPWEISKLDMNYFLYEDIGDIISTIPGVFLFDHGSAGQQLFFSRHGSSVNHVKVYLDGRPVYNPLTGGTDLNILPVGLVNELKMENNLSNYYVPNSSEILSVQSRKYEEEVPYSQIYHHKAGLGFSDVDFIFGQPIARKMNILLGGDIKSFDGRDNAYVYEHQNFRGKLEYLYSPGWRFEYSILNNTFNRSTPGQLMDSGNYCTPDAQYKMQRNDHTLNVFGNVLNSNWQNFRANIYYSNLVTKLSDDSYDLKNRNHSSYAGLNFLFLQKFWGQLFTVAGDFEHDWTDATEVGAHRFSFGSISIQHDWASKEKFGLKLKANLNFHEMYNTNFSGGVGSFLNISKYIKLNLLALQSIRSPSLFELFSNTNFIGNSHLKNETHQKIIAEIECNFLDNVQIKTNFYKKNIQQLIQYQPLDSTQANFQNGRNLQFYGFDFFANWKLGTKIQLKTTLSAIDNQNMFDLPNLQLSENIQYNNRFFENYLNTTIRVEGKFIGERKSIIVYPYQYSASYANLSPIFILNATAVFGFGNLNIFLKFENILNEEYQIIYGFPMRERTFHYGVRWEFWD